MTNTNDLSNINSYLLVILVFGINGKAITPAFGYLH